MEDFFYFFYKNKNQGFHRLNCHFPSPLFSNQVTNRCTPRANYSKFIYAFSANAQPPSHQLA